ncbi:MAG: hypothetical protein PSV23_07110 [Brevundimonas sp.]|uniref:hypothetical protein n=1 Tax=Brevundimonas sp. TaxID=1871086 RepID=UPI0024893171|nr:hypothetical protein [Brevundimonas sp.]MDI1326553.1 hypothetical protein [Brevundimonas sp.]
MNFSKFTIPLFTCILIQGCGSLENRYATTTIPLEAATDNRAVILMSSGAPQHCFSTSTAIAARDARTKKLTNPGVFIAVDSYVQPSDFPTHHGLLSAFTLPPGSYYFEPGIANPFVTGIRIPTFTFEARAGETTYIGELFMLQACGLNTAFEVRDKFDRDLKMAITKNKLFSQRQVIKRLMVTGETIN